MQKLYQSCYVSHNETLKPDKRFCYDFVIRMFFHLASFFGSSTADYLVPRPSIPHRGTASVYLLLFRFLRGGRNMVHFLPCRSCRRLWSKRCHAARPTPRCRRRYRYRRGISCNAKICRQPL